eukprot:m.253411 g.253411  ORF g.253411 m.253411 type:complete len:123 (+) comp17192_c0_seq14:159-527(+)
MKNTTIPANRALTQQNSCCPKSKITSICDTCYNNASRPSAVQQHISHSLVVRLPPEQKLPPSSPYLFHHASHCLNTNTARARTHPGSFTTISATGFPVDHCFHELNGVADPMDPEAKFTTAT